MKSLSFLVLLRSFLVPMGAKCRGLGGPHPLADPASGPASAPGPAPASGQNSRVRTCGARAT